MDPRRLVACLLGALPALAPLNAAAAAPAAAYAGRPLEVRVREEPAADAWRVTYRPPAPVAGLVFQRGRELSRGGAWEVLTAGVEWGVREGRDALVASAPIAEIALRFPSDFSQRAKGYELNFSFTDGGRLLYTGDLSVAPLVGESAGTPWDHDWRFATAAGRWVGVLASEGEGGLAWREPAAGTGNGTYVWFGPRPPERRERMSFVVDPGLPGWMRDRVEWALPRLVDGFAARTEVELAFRPLVLISYQPAEISGLVFSGGTLDGLVQMAAIGDGWADETAEADRLWLDRTAHEIFHFWVGETLTTPLEYGDAWLKEGAADLFALEAMAALEPIDAAARERRLVEIANDCLTGLAGEPLLGAAEPGRFHSLYSCGATLWHWAGAAVGRATGSDDGLGELLRALIEAVGEEGELTSYRFLETLHRLTGDPWAGAPLARLLFVGVPAEADRFFLERARAAGLEVELAPPAAATLRPGAPPPAAHTSWKRLLGLKQEAPLP